MEAPDALETYPSWVGQMLQATLPSGEIPLATYYSWTYDVRQVPAVVVLPTALVGVEMAFVDHSEELLTATVTAIPLDRVVSVRLASRAWLGADPGAGLQAVEIEVEGGLHPFGPSIRLPIAQNDYRGDTAAAREVARGIAEALIAAMPRGSGA